jgi:uroporphyrinogen-III synthase
MVTEAQAVQGADRRAPRPSMGGRVVALLEARRGAELAGLVETYGGVPYLAPALKEEPVEDTEAIATLLDQLQAQPLDIAIFQTGVGTRALFRGLETLNRTQEFKAALEQSVVAVRGPKPLAALRELDVRVDVRTPEPYTTAELLAALAPTNLQNKIVFVQHYGERNVDLVNALEAQQARLLEAEVYRWTLPEDTTPLENLISQELMSSRIDALVVTSQVQVRHLFQIANKLGFGAVLPDLLRDRVVTVAVGPVAARALEAHGIRVDLQPSHPKMGALVAELGALFASRGPVRVRCPE